MTIQAFSLEDLLFDEAQAAQIIDVTDKCMQAWRCRGGGPAYLKIGRLVRYRKSDINAWLESRVRSQGWQDTNKKPGCRRAQRRYND